MKNLYFTIVEDICGTQYHPATDNTRTELSNLYGIKESDVRYLSKAEVSLIPHGYRVIFNQKQTQTNMNEQQKLILRKVMLMRINDLRVMVNKFSLEATQIAVENEIDELTEILKLI